jgi:hypothetical protein
MLKCEANHRDTTSVIRQNNSWSRLQISRHGFLQILSDLRVSSAFADFVCAFGFKTSHSDENFGGYHRQLHRKLAQESVCRATQTSQSSSSNHGTEEAHLELCYNIRYAEQVGRDFEYPWVLRHMAAYQICSPQTQSSKWILLQPPRLIENELGAMLQDTGRPGCIAMINLMILNATETKWRPYINHLESEINAFVSHLPTRLFLITYSITCLYL